MFIFQSQNHNSNFNEEIYSDLVEYIYSLDICDFSHSGIIDMNTFSLIFGKVSVLNFFFVSSQVDRVSYLLQEIYGIENKNNQETKVRNSDSTNESCCCKKFEFQAFFNSFFFFPFSPLMTRTVTTATSVSSACLTCETRSFCPADICVCATPVQTLCGTRPTTAPSAGCVRSPTL